MSKLLLVFQPLPCKAAQCCMNSSFLQLWKIGFRGMKGTFITVFLRNRRWGLLVSVYQEMAKYLQLIVLSKAVWIWSCLVSTSNSALIQLRFHWIPLWMKENRHAENSLCVVLLPPSSTYIINMCKQFKA